jgi:acyl carrier protein
LKALKEIITTGEQLQITPAIKDLFKELKHCTLDNHYGPSETHVVTAFRLGEGVDSWSARPPIGKPIDNSQTYVLDRNLRLVPVGITGELFIGGTALARGYLNRADLTAEKFLPNPFATDGARLYKAGDLARYKEDGNIDFLGRIDHQVKIRGFRIELSEIEATLGQHPAVEEVVVLACEDTPGNRQLVAYIVADHSCCVSSEELREFIRASLPEYMVPTAFVMLEAIPLTRNGKVDRRALPAPDHARPDLKGAFIAPRSEAEKVVAKLWANILNIEQVGVYDNFFNLGGHSLMATRIIFRLRDIFRVSLPLRALFEQPTVSGLVDTMAEMLGGRDAVDEIAQVYLAIENLSEDEVKSILDERGANEYFSAVQLNKIKSTHS